MKNLFYWTEVYSEQKSVIDLAGWAIPYSNLHTEVHSTILSESFFKAHSITVYLQQEIQMALKSPYWVQPSSSLFIYSKTHQGICCSAFHHLLWCLSKMLRFVGSGQDLSTEGFGDSLLSFDFVLLSLRFILYLLQKTQNFSVPKYRTGRACGDSPMVKSTCCFCRGPKFSSKYPHDISQLFVAQFRESTTLF